MKETNPGPWTNCNSTDMHRNKRIGGEYITQSGNLKRSILLLFFFFILFLLLLHLLFFPLFPPLPSQNVIMLYLSIEMIIWFLSSILLMWHITFITLHMLSHSCIPGINSVWSLYVIFLMFCWICFASVWLNIFASIFIRDTGLYPWLVLESFLSFTVLIWFWCQGNARLLIKWVWNFFLIVYIVKEFEKIGVLWICLKVYFYLPFDFYIDLLVQ